MTYLQLITSHLERNGASAELITVVEDYLEHVHPHQDASVRRHEIHDFECSKPVSALDLVRVPARLQLQT